MVKLLSPSVEHHPYLLTLKAVREQCQLVYSKGLRNELDFIQVHTENIDDCIDYILQIAKLSYPTFSWETVPSHTRWRHYEIIEANQENKKIDLIETLLQQWTSQQIHDIEQAKRVLDLMTVSVLLDAGAGNQWKYIDPSSQKIYFRSEGLALAVYHMFMSGQFSSQPIHQPYQVDATGLKSLTVDILKEGFQVTEENPLIGLDCRCLLLNRLGLLLESNPHFQSKNNLSRPSNFMDTFTTPRSSPRPTVALSDLWCVVMSLHPIFPQHSSTSPFPHCDIGYLPSLDLWVPFHKLQQWLTYTYVEVLERLAGVKVTETELLTGLAEYRNGGLLLDLRILSFKQTGQAPLDVQHPAVVEWRACTVAVIDTIVQRLQERGHANVSLAKVLEAGTWKAGRAIAKQLRPDTGAAPIQIVSDGTVF